ncbi:MAG: ImmA/IrrE family metallo-endopeptidase [Verrucomicrobiae bacterium]
MSNRVQIKPELFQWAQERSRMSMDELRKKFPRLPQWISGEAEPTVKQLEKFAGQTYTPLGYFFLAKPPDERLPIPDFRTVTDRRVSRPSPHLLDTIYAVQLRQEWMRGFLVEQGEPPLAFIGSRTLKDSPDVVAADIRRTLGLEARWSRSLGTWEEALRVLIQKIEGVGVLVMINGVVENNTHRPLDVEEFRGFVLSDSHAPAIFINGSDAKAAQMFTLVHELAHLWLGEGGVSDFKELLPSKNAVEIFCNKVAAEFLVPAREMKLAWQAVKDEKAPFERLAREFKVSPVVAARRVLDLDLISRTRYFAFYKEYKEAAAIRRARGPGGGNFYLTLGSRLGKRFPAAVYVAAKEGRLPYREAYQLTGLSGASYDRFGREMGFAL